MVAYSTLGFSLFDAAHILIGVYFFERAFRERGETFLYSVAESATEIICSILLLCFILVIADRNLQKEEEHHYYTFAWLIASVSMLLPKIFQFTKDMDEGLMTKAVGILSIVEIRLSLFAFLMFIASLFAPRENKNWGILMLLAAIAFFLLVTVSLATSILEAPLKDGWWLAGSIIIAIAPIFPVGFGAYSGLKMVHYQKTCHQKDKE